MKKILPFEGQLDLTAGVPDAGDDVDDMIQKLDMAMQVRVPFFSVHADVSERLMLS